MTQSKDKINISESHSKAINDALGPMEDILCGIGPIKHRFLQALATPATYLILSSFIALIQGTFYTYNYATLSTIEKRYDLSSKLSGLTTTGNDVVGVLLAIPLTFLAGRGHRPRFLAFGMYLSGFGCIIAALPHFTIFPNDSTITIEENEDNKYKLCGEDLKNETAKCSKPSSSFFSSNSLPVVAMLLISQMLCSVGTLLYYTIGHSYMDEAVSKEKVPFYVSISGAARDLGPVCAYSLASWALGNWVYPSMTSSIPMKPSHPHWIGAWWIGYLIIGSLLLCLSWPLALIPRILPATRRRREKEIAFITQNNVQDLQSYLSRLRSKGTCSFKEMLLSLRRLLVNPIFILIITNQIFFFFAFMGYITFKSKYIEHQFQMSASAANKFIALVSLIATIIGWVGSGLSLTYFKPKSKTVLVYMALLSTCVGLCHFVQMFIKCDHAEIEGLKEVLERDSSFVSERNDICGSATYFAPVCHKESSRVFFSPCQAGCRNRQSVNGTYIYTHCSCLQSSTSSEMDWSLEDGFCPQSCPYFTLYLAVSVLGKMFHAATRVPVNVILFRCVEERDKDLGLGVLNLFIALTFIATPVIFGWAIDHSCSLWSNSCNGSSGRCLIYDNDLFRMSIHGLPTAVMAISLLMNIILLKYHKRLKLYSEVEANKTQNCLIQKQVHKQNNEDVL